LPLLLALDLAQQAGACVVALARGGPQLSLELADLLFE
jgi:hypothetical protein